MVAGHDPNDKNVDMADIVDTLPFGVIVFALSEDQNPIIEYINSRVYELFLLSEEISMPSQLSALSNSVDISQLQDKIHQQLNTGEQTFVSWNIHSGGLERFLNCQLIALRSEDAKKNQCVCIITDNTAEKIAEQNLLHHAFHDALTGLPNRVLFRTKLEEAVSNNSQNKSSEAGCAVIIINIDRFQNVNESFGHSAGDRFLVSIASTLRRCIRSVDTLARLSGDEFAVLVTSCLDIGEVEMVADRIHNAFLLPYDLEDNKVYVSVSIGIATSLSSSAHPEDLIRDADYAMHKAKMSGKARTEVYLHQGNMSDRNQFHLETELRRAIENDEMELHYQPIIDLKTMELSGFEALARWTHSEKGFVSPAEFIPLAEETGIIVALGRWAMRTACEQIAAWLKVANNPDNIKINVNVSGIQFARDNVADMVEETLKETGIDGKHLRIELTESSIMANPTQISDELHKVRELGVTVALDDFGTGFSSLNYLVQFPLDVIKIDRSFIAQMEVDNPQYEILRMISMLATSLGLETVGEGLEDLAHVDMLRDLDFDFGQGYYLARPMPADEATPLVNHKLDHWKLYSQ